MLYKSERDFQLWEYRVSHGQLLLRSPLTPESPEGDRNIDLIFLGVVYVQLPRFLPGLILDQASAKETAKVMGSLIRLSQSDYVYSLRSKSRFFYVVAAAYRVYENDLDLGESSLETFLGSDVPRELGRLLARS